MNDRIEATSAAPLLRLFLDSSIVDHVFSMSVVLMVFNVYCVSVIEI